jgi:hypothetical protein
MFAVLLVLLLLACVSAPLLGKDTSDGRAEGARPPQGWFPPISR